MRNRCKICQNVIAELEKYEDIIEFAERNIEGCLGYLKNNPAVPCGAIYLLKEIRKSLEENKGVKMQISNEVLMLGQIDELKKQNKSLQKENQILRKMLFEEMNKNVQSGKKLRELLGD